MEALITIIFTVIMLGVIYSAVQLKYISELLRDEKKPFLAEDDWPHPPYDYSGGLYAPEVKPKKGKPR